MLFKRENAASLVIRNKYLWVSGGRNGNTLSSTEFIETKALHGPELPKALEGHKMISISDDLTFFIGGFSPISGSCTNPLFWRVGDGVCDDETNDYEWNFDDGDCCGSNVVTSVCSKCRCYNDLGGGGNGIEVTTTFYFHHDKAHHESGQWSCGPTMQYRRKNHAVGVVTDKTSLKKFVVVTGDVGEEGTSMTSEILSEDLWSKGKIAHRNLLLST